MSANLPESIRTMYTDAYKLHETLYEMGNSDEEWLNAAELSKNVCLHHDMHPLIIDLVLAVTNQLNRERNQNNGA